MNIDNVCVFVCVWFTERYWDFVYFRKIRHFPSIAL